MEKENLTDIEQNIGSGKKAKTLDFSRFEGAEFCRFEKGQRVIAAGELPTDVYVVASGQCKRIKTSDKGDELIMSVYEKGDLLCVAMVYCNIPSASDIVATKMTCCYRIPRTAFMAALDTNVPLLKQVLDQIMLEHMDLIGKFRSKQEGRTPNLICRFLLNHAAETAEGLLVEKKFSNAEISRHVGVHKVTAAKIVNQLRHEGLIERTAAGILLLDVGALRAYASNERTMNY